MPDAAPLEPGDPASLGHYEVVGRLGAGGQGAVYLGRTPGNEYVAIKLLHAQMARDPSARARFTREVAAAQKVAPFCTSRVYEADVHGDQPYIVSEFIDGPSLHDVVAMNGPRGPVELERLAIGTVTALAAIHEAGIVHRDFKPNNVLLAADGPRVVDFGIARTINSQESAVTATGMVVGTPGYLAPEQLTGAPLQPAVDIFAWGATMVFAATGQSPFEADTLPVIINRILNDEPDLSALRGPLRDVVGRCLSKDPALRPPAHQLLLQLLGNAGVAPGPAPARKDLLDQGTRIAAQLPAPPPVAHHAPPPPPPVARRTPPPAPPMTPPPMAMPGPATPPPMAMPGPRTPPPMAMPIPGPATPPPMRTGPPGPAMTQPPFQQPYQPPPKRSKGPIIAAVGCGGLAVLAIIVFAVAVIVGANNPSPGSTYTPYSYNPPTSGTTGGIPSDLNGTWTGTITNSSDSGQTNNAKIVLFGGLSTGSVTYTSATTTCSGLLTLQESTAYKVTLKETITIGRSDCQDGYVLLYPSSSFTRYEWRASLSDTSPTWTGTLTKG
jgi:predicted Ser/Thr protein kinase